MPRPVPKADDLARVPRANAEGLSRGLPRAGDAPRDRRVAFGFRYWRQREFFGIGQAKSEWFAACLEKLGEMSRHTLGDIFENSALRDSLRWHKIDWDKCPITHAHLQLPAPYNDEENYSIYQFQITTGLGRVACFRDEELVLQVVLLDELHNLQGSKKRNYATEPTRIASTPYAALRHQLNLAADRMCGEECRTSKAVRSLEEKCAADEGLLLVPIDDGDFTTLRTFLLANPSKTLRDVLLAGLIDGI